MNHNEPCNCWECRLLRSGNIPDTVIAPDGTWGCQWCAGTGYEDYPTMKTPCRISGHEKMGREEQGLDRVIMSASSLVMPKFKWTYKP